MTSASTAAPADLAGGGVDARRDVGGHDRRAAGVDRLDRGVGRRARRALEPGAEDRVDDDAGAGERVRGLAGLDLAVRAVEALEVRRRVGRKLARGPEQQRLDVEPGVAQMPRGDQPVAAVVALAADDAGRPVAAAPRSRPRQAPRPAASISSSEGIPCSSIAQASAARMRSAS